MADVLNTQGLAAALAAEFGAALEAVLGQTVTVAAEPAPAASGWATPVAVTGPLAGTLTALVDAEGARTVAAQLLRLEGDAENSVVIDMLRGLWAQAAAATERRDGFAGLALAAGAPGPGDLAAGGDRWVVRAGDAVLATLALTGDLVLGAVTPAGPEADAGASSGNLAALLDIELPLVVRFARTELSLRELTMLGPGSMVDMGRSPDDPVQLLVGSQVIAEGEVVVVAGNYGVRILSLVSPAERLRAMEL